MALINALVVHPDDRVERIEIDNTDLAAYQKVVGGYIEGVYGRIATVYVNEEGRILNLPINPSVSLFVQRFIYRDSAYSRLHGTALIVGPPDEEGNDTHVRQSVVSYYMMEN